MSSVTGRPGAKQSSQAKAKDKQFEEQKMRMLERAEKTLAKKNAKARELENWEKAKSKLKDMCEAPPQERNLDEMSEGILFIADLGKDDFLEELTHRRFPVLLTEHFKNAVICSNVLYCIGASAMASFEKKLIPPPKEREDGIHGTAGIDVNTIDFVPLDASKPINPIRLRQLVMEQKESITALVEKVFHRENTDLSDVWFATVVTIIACIRAHQADTLVMSNGIFALGRLAQAAAGLKSLASALRGVETVVQSMHLHDHDSIMASNGCLAIARICHCPNIDYHEDRNVAFDTIDKNSAIQEKAIQEGALQAVYDAERNHGEDPIVARSFAEAVGGLAIGSSHLGMEDVQEVAGRICKAMSHDFHEIEASRDHYPTIFDEVHGRDEFVTAYGAKALGSMVLVKSTHKAAGQDKRFPYLISDPDKQDAIAKVGAIQCMCMALKQFPKKKDTVLSLCGPALAHAIRLHENNQRLFVRHKGVDFIMAIMNKWEEDHDFYFLMLRTLRVLLEGTDGIRNYWFLDTNKGRDVGKFVVKTYSTEAKEFGTLEDIKEVKERRRQRENVCLQS